MVGPNQKDKKIHVENVLKWVFGYMFLQMRTFLSHTGKHGVIKNRKKFYFYKKGLVFVDFWPSHKTQRAIRDFPGHYLSPYVVFSG